VIGLIKFFFILTVIVYIFKFFSAYFIKYFINRMSRKMKDFESNDFSSPPKNQIKKPKNEMGEYIDYEEID